MNGEITDPWCLIESEWNPDSVRRSESIFAIGNGRFGQRANFEETYSGDSLSGSYLAGVYYPDATRVGWWKNGYPESFAKVLNAANWIAIPVIVGGVELDLNTAAKVNGFRRSMSMRDGILTRSFRVTLSNGAVVDVKAERFCSMCRPEVAAIRYSVTLVEGHFDVILNPAIIGDVQNEDSNWDDVFWQTDEVRVTDDACAGVQNTTMKTGFVTGTAMAVIASLQDGSGSKELSPSKTHSESRSAGLSYVIHGAKNTQVVLEKYVGIATSMYHDAGAVLDVAMEGASVARDLGFEVLKDEHREEWESIWERGDVQIEGDDLAQQAIRFNVFHLNQTYRGDDPRLNIGPKGFTGEKYGGASYWDTEAYCLPFYLASHEDHVAKQLLLYRYHHLAKAIENAEKLGFTGGAALFPMVTMNGEECHNEWEITFEEIHRNGAMVFAISNYINYTGDEEYMASYGFPVLVAIARFWTQRVHWSEDKSAYVMLGVTGPNEYENNVNNNWYTNYIAAWCLNYAVRAATDLREERPKDFERWSAHCALDFEEECRQWSERAKDLYLPRLEGTRVFLQQDGFMDKEQRSVADLPENQRPINQHWSWDRVLRSVYIKQADVLQGLYFFQDDFDADTLRENFDFYEPKTVHESSLSPCVHVVLAASLHRLDKAYQLYMRTARLDLDDYNKEVHEGLHITAMAGTWMAVVEGFGGFKVRNGVPCFNGRLPSKWSALRFKISFRKRLLDVRISQLTTVVTLLSGPALSIRIDDRLEELQVPV